MAIFQFKCPDCGVFSKILPTATPSFPCKKCQKESPREFGDTTNHLREKIDTGSNEKPIERPVNITQLIRDHSKVR